MQKIRISDFISHFLGISSGDESISIVLFNRVFYHLVVGHCGSSEYI